jgi:zinc/manganese transport system permease protein
MTGTTMTGTTMTGTTMTGTTRVTMTMPDEPQLTWNLVEDVREVLTYPFMVNAFRAGAVVAVLAGAVGWFMVLRRQSFAGHTFALVGFPGAAGAVLVGISATYGLFAFAVGAALVIGLVPAARGRTYGEESAVTGTVQSFALACGYLFVTLYGAFFGEANALLFGSFLGITATQVWTLLLVAVVALGLLTVLGRPLLFASVDPDVAAARGVPVRGLATAFLVLLALAAAEVSQITGTLLVFALLVIPAATAQAWTTRPALGVALSVVLGCAVTWVSLFVAYWTPYPIGFLLTSIAFGTYVAVVLWRRLRPIGRLA